jgi:hypothetical protein
MKKLFLILLLAIAFAACGCESTMCMLSKKDLHKFDGGAQPVYVANPEMQREYLILKNSEIYSLTNQSTGARKLTLLPIKHFGRCGNPIMLTVLTIGIVPGILPSAQAFEYDLETDGKVEHCVHPLPTYDRVSIWEWFVKHDDDRVLAEALAWSSKQQQLEQISLPK